MWLEKISTNYILVSPKFIMIWNFSARPLMRWCLSSIYCCPWVLCLIFSDIDRTSVVPSDRKFLIFQSRVPDLLADLQYLSIVCTNSDIYVCLCVHARVCVSVCVRVFILNNGQGHWILLLEVLRNQESKVLFLSTL